MSHVDEGLLHAYIDGAFEAGTPERADIEAHLAGCADCRVRLGDARRIRDAAGAALAAATPVSVEPPAWATVLAERARRGGTGGGAAAGRPARVPRIPLAWAASVVLALGAGWMARAMLAEPGVVPMEAARTLSPESEEAASLDEVAGRGAAAPDAAATQADAAARTPVATEPAAPPAPQVAGQAFRDDRNELRREARERQAGEAAVVEDLAKAAEPSAAPLAARMAGVGNVAAPSPLEVAADSARDRWVGTTGDAIAAAFERIPVTVEGQTPDTLQLASVANRPIARAIYILPAGVVEVLQWPVTADADAADTAEAEAAQGRAVLRRLRGVEVLVRGSSEDAVSAVRGWLR